MKRTSIACMAILAAGSIAVADARAAEEKIHGSLESRASAAKMTLKTDDGRVVSVDTSQITEGLLASLKIGEKVTVVGSRGAGNEFVAKDVLLESARGGRAWQRLNGVVQSRISATKMILKTDDGRVLSVDTSQVSDNVVKALEVGERVEVVGLTGGTNDFLARYIQQKGSSPAASPK